MQPTDVCWSLTHVAACFDVCLVSLERANKLAYAQHFFEESRQALDVKPTEAMYTLMSNTLLQAGEVQEAADLLQEMEAEGYRPPPMLQAAMHTFQSQSETPNASLSTTSSRNMGVSE
jgi:pentatricopeptide repeat protein